MPEFKPYPNEDTGVFAKRMSKQAKSGGSMVKSANRFMQTYEMRKKEKDKAA